MDATSKEMFEAFIMLPIDKFLGTSELPVWALKDSVHIVNPILTTIKRIASRSKAEFPHSSKKTRVILVFKKGSTANPINYRPISIRPVVSNLFEKKISIQMNQFLLKKNVLKPEEFGLRHAFLTNDALLYTTET